MASQAESKNDALERSSSRTSIASRKSGTVRGKPRKQSLVTPESAKTLESFPSLSPDVSPDSRKAVLSQQRADETPRATSKTGPSIVKSLITSSPSFRGRSALFDDATSPNDLPGGLHQASDEHIQSLVQKKGAVELVRQLALDLAERDAQITALRQRAEERERELKRMLREVEVSNMDIEKRLHRLEGPEDSSRSLSQGVYAVSNVPKEKGKVSDNMAGIDQMMGEAMGDNVGLPGYNSDYIDTLQGGDRNATVRARSTRSRGSDARSLASSIDSQGQLSGTIKGWKDYLWSGQGTTSRNSKASSITDYQGDNDTSKTDQSQPSNSRRKGLSDDVFTPPEATTSEETSTRASRKSSASVASWSLKLFGGSSQSNRDQDGQGTKRARAASAGSQSSSSRLQSRTSGKIPPVPPVPRSAKDALMKVNTKEANRTIRASQLPKQGPGNTVRLANSQQANSIPMSPATVDEATNLGPVEMDTIHPPESRPPTLSQLAERRGSSANLLTDRYGFIYDQRRRKKEAEAEEIARHKRGKSNASANVEMVKGTRDSLRSKLREQDQGLAPETPNRPDTPASLEERADGKPGKRWQDYLKVASINTELLSHTPAAKPLTTVLSPDAGPSPLKRSGTSGDFSSKIASVGTIPEPEITPITAGKAEIATLSPASPTVQAPSQSENEPVRLLLAQLTEVHDSLQREKTIRWNEFLRKVRAERKREGANATASDGRLKQAIMPEVMLTDGEVIGVAGLGNKGKVGRAKWNEFKHLVLGGIPVSYRSKIWTECSGASALRVPGYYEELVEGKNLDSPDDPAILSQIEMDIRRTLTDNVFFRKGPGVQKLNEVLLAYSRRNRDVGYCQGMNLIAASLLLVTPTAEDAFWLMTTLIENILPGGYYDHSLLTSRADQSVLRQYVSELLPKLSTHMDELSIELEALTFQWFLSVFTDTLSAEALFRVWDVVLCFNDGSTFLFQVAVALLKLNEPRLLDCDNPAQVYSYIGNEMTDHAISIDGLIAASDALKNTVTRNQVEDRRMAAVEDQKERERQREREQKSARLRGGSGSTSGTGGGAAVDGLRVEEPRPFDG